MLRLMADLVPTCRIQHAGTRGARDDTTAVHLGVATAYALLYCGCVLALAAAAFESPGLQVTTWLCRARASAWRSPGDRADVSASACAARRFAARTLPRPHPLEELSYYPSGTGSRPPPWASGSFADLAWLRAVQYYGAHRSSDMQFVRMAPCVRHPDHAVAGFVPAYVFGGFALAQEAHAFAQPSVDAEGLGGQSPSGAWRSSSGSSTTCGRAAATCGTPRRYFELAARLPGQPAGGAAVRGVRPAERGGPRVAWMLWRDVARSSPQRLPARDGGAGDAQDRTGTGSGHVDLAQAPARNSPRADRR
jgi:hypothetical protein